MPTGEQDQIAVQDPYGLFVDGSIKSENNVEFKGVEIYQFYIVAIVEQDNLQNSKFDLCNFHGNPILFFLDICHLSSKHQEDHNMLMRRLRFDCKEHDLIPKLHLDNNKLKEQIQKKARKTGE